MAFIQCDFFSDVLELSCSMNVILPQASAEIYGMADHVHGKPPYQTLWLLHGRTDDHTGWIRRTALERHVSELGIAVVMPAANLSFYTNMAAGPRYYEFINEELPRLARSFFPLSDKREDNFIAGLSMGGYGTMLHALGNPDKYCAAASLSGVLDLQAYIDARGQDGTDMQHHIGPAFGDITKLKDSRLDLLALASEAVASDRELPALYACCGTGDYLLQSNRNFRQHAEEIGLPLTYEEGPGIHDWAFWDHWIQRVLDWLPLKTGT